MLINSQYVLNTLLYIETEQHYFKYKYFIVKIFKYVSELQ